MNAEQILSEIREANLSYLMLAQSLIRSDREQALYSPRHLGGVGGDDRACSRHRR